MSPQPDNPFLHLGPAPKKRDPQAQLQYLKSVVTAFHSTGHPRIKPLGKKLDEALLELAQGTKRGLDPETLATKFGQRVRDLQLQTFELLLTVVNQVRGTLRVKLQRGLPKPEKADTEKLQTALAVFSQGVRKMVGAAKKKDAAAEQQGRELLDEASRLMKESGNELSS